MIKQMMLFDKLWSSSIPKLPSMLFSNPQGQLSAIPYDFLFFATRKYDILENLHYPPVEYCLLN